MNYSLRLQIPNGCKLAFALALMCALAMESNGIKWRKRQRNAEEWWERFDKLHTTHPEMPMLKADSVKNEIISLLNSEDIPMSDTATGFTRERLKMLASLGQIQSRNCVSDWVENLYQTKEFNEEFGDIIANYIEEMKTRQMARCNEVMSQDLTNFSAEGGDTIVSKLRRSIEDQARNSIGSLEQPLHVYIPSATIVKGLTSHVSSLNMDKKKKRCTLIAGYNRILDELLVHCKSVETKLGRALGIFEIIRQIEPGVLDLSATAKDSLASARICKHLHYMNDEARQRVLVAVSKKNEHCKLNH